jgi:hypothetical protein
MNMHMSFFTFLFWRERKLGRLVNKLKHFKWNAAAVIIQKLRLALD